MVQRYIRLFLIICSVFMIVNASEAAAGKAVFVIGENVYNLNDQAKFMDAAPFIENGRTYVPVRFLALSLGVSEQGIKWDAEKQEISLQLGDKIVSLQIGSKDFYLNENKLTMDTVPVIKESRTYLPARYIAEAFGYNVSWDANNQSITLTLNTKEAGAGMAGSAAASPRATLPPNYTKNEGTQLEGFESLTGFTKTGTGTIEPDTTNFKYGRAGIKLTTNAGYPGVLATKAISPSINMLEGSRLIHVWLYFHDTNCDGANIYLFAEDAKAFEATVPSEPGWKHYVFKRSDWVTYDEDSWANKRAALMIGIVAKAGTTTAVTFDSITYGVEQIPVCVFSFDDGYTSVYTEAFPYMQARNIPGTVYINSDRIGKTGYMTWAQLEELYAAGWAVGSHTSDHSLRGLTLAQQIESLQVCQDALLAHGFTRSAKHLAYPGGVYDANTITAMDMVGVETGRWTIGGIQFTPIANAKLLRVAFEMGTVDGSYKTLEQGKAVVDNIINYEGSGFIYGHKLAAAHSNDIEWNTADFQALIDYVVERKIKCVTIDQWYQGLTNPIPAV